MERRSQSETFAGTWLLLRNSWLNVVGSSNEFHWPQPSACIVFIGNLEWSCSATADCDDFVAIETKACIG